jgi:putative FmdB family regulatory protein
MPIHEYKCDSCGYIEEIYYSNFNDVKCVIQCPKCICQAKIKFSNTARPIFKGSGFYETDYIKKNVVDNG